jgi:lysozyme
MRYSSDGLDLTEQFESCRLVPYQDSKGVWTNGWGNTHHVDPHVTISLEQANADLLANVQWAVVTVNAMVTVPLSQDEFDALVDFVFNVGSGNFATSTLLKLLNAGDIAGASAQFERWDQSAGVVVAGLLRRRLAEKAEFDKTPPSA